MPTDDILPLYNLFDSGISSPDTIYNIAPAAKLKQIAITASDIEPISAPNNAPTPVVIPDKITYSIIFDVFIPPFFMGIDIDIPSGISCKQIAIAKLNPNFIDASKPEPIANPSGKLCIASPILTIIPVFNNELSLLWNFSFESIFLPTIELHNIIITIPIIVPNITLDILLISNASGIRSKHITAIINPDANDNIKLNNLFDAPLNFIPIIPPIVVPNVPKE